MNEAYRTLAAATIVTMAVSTVSSLAQTAPARDIGAPPPSIRPPIAGPALAGTWSGTVLQIQRAIEYAVTLEITARGAEINYPELHCGGKLSRIGASRDYAFFLETITRGTVDDDGRCSNGTITMARAGDDLAWGWFGLVKGEVVTAYGTLTRKSDANQQVPVGEEGQSVVATPGPTPPPLVRKPRPPAKPLAPSINGIPR